MQESPVPVRKINTIANDHTQSANQAPQLLTNGLLLVAFQSLGKMHIPSIENTVDRKWKIRLPNNPPWGFTCK